MLGVPFGVLGGLGWPLWSHWVAYENVKKTLVFTLFSAFGSSWRAPSGVVFSFFDFRSYLLPFFSVSDRFLVFPIVFTSVFRFPIVFPFFFGFLGRCFLHERIHGRDSAPRGSGLSRTQRNPAAPRIGSELKSYLKGNTRY